MKFFNKLRAKFHGVPYRINDFFYNDVIMAGTESGCYPYVNVRRSDGTYIIPRLGEYVLVTFAPNKHAYYKIVSITRKGSKYWLRDYDLVNVDLVFTDPYPCKKEQNHEQRN